MATAAVEEKHETLTGGCHCGRVRFRCRVPVDSPILECNCSICTMRGFLHLIVKREDFLLEAPAEGESALAAYRFNTQKARHLWCPTCGVQSFYRPRSHPDGYSVNARCLDGGVPAHRRVQPFDGQNWEQSVAGIR